MHRSIPTFVLLLTTLVPAAAGAAEAAAVVGSWRGTLDVAGSSLRVMVHVERGADGGLTGTLDSIDQGATGIAIDTMTLEGEAFRFEIRRLLAAYEGRLEPGGERITGRWSQGGLTLPLDLERSDERPELVRPQEPQPPYPYAEQEVTFDSAAEPADGAEPIRLAGTLTLPPGDGPHPAAVLISGSGPQDRDETVFGHRPFLVLADYLTRRGLAVLRYDDRGVGGSGGSLADATSADLAEDARGALAYLAGRPEVDARRVGLIGHSEGGLIAPLVARGAARVAFVVLIAGPGVPGDELLTEQSALLLRAFGAGEEAVAEAREGQRRAFQILRDEPDDERARQAVRELAVERLRAMPEAQRRALGAADVEAAAEAQAERAVTPWVRYFIGYDPRPALAELRCPVLAINGELDVQVGAEQNLPPILAALAGGDSPEYAVVQLAGLNHLLQTADTGLPGEYATIEETMAPLALATIGDWLAARFVDRPEP